MKIIFFKYLSWGLVGGFFLLHFPGLPVDFFVLTLALAFPVLGLGSTLFLAAILSLFYGAHSVSPWAAWWLPAATVLMLLRFWRSFLNWPRFAQLSGGVTTLLAAQWVWGFLWAGGGAGAFWGWLQVWLGTLSFGLLVLPFSRWAVEKMRRWLPRPRPRMGELPLYLGKIKQPRLSGDSRRPFGLERV